VGTRVTVALVVGLVETVDDGVLCTIDWMAGGEPIGRLGVDTPGESGLGGTMVDVGVAAARVGGKPGGVDPAGPADTRACTALVQPAAATANSPSPAAMTRRRDG
jgi:hypothetical protein